MVLALRVIELCFDSFLMVFMGWRVLWKRVIDFEKESSGMLLLAVISEPISHDIAEKVFCVFSRRKTTPNHQQK